MCGSQPINVVESYRTGGGVVLDAPAASTVAADLPASGSFVAAATMNLLTSVLSKGLDREARSNAYMPPMTAMISFGVG